MMKHYRIEIGLGTGHKADGSALSWIERASANQVAESEALRFCGGFTWMETAGGWRNGAGNIVTEPGRMLVLHTQTEEPLPTFMHRCRLMAATVKGAFKQEAVALSVVEETFELV